MSTTEATQAQYIFRKFTGAGGAAALIELTTRTEKTFENDWLDFKSGRSQDKDISRIWSKIAGAFANNEGGVVVWGIAAEKDPLTKIDAVRFLDPASDVYALKSRLMELRHQATDPPIADIEIVEVPIAQGSPEGFVVCHVPESRSKPHRSEHADKKFYLRMGDSSKECSVSILRQLFYPLRNHRLQVSLTRVTPPVMFPRLVVRPFTTADGNDLKATVVFGIGNIGTSSIEDVFVSVECGAAKIYTYKPLDEPNRFKIEAVDNFYRVAEILHPRMRARLRLAIASKDHGWDQPWRVKVFAKDMLPKMAALDLQRGLMPDQVTTFGDCF